jgi:hypothetical protein
VLRGNKQVVDPHLGDLVRRRGMWRGQLVLGPGQPVPLAIPGDRHVPEPDALDLARSTPAAFAANRAAILEALAEHREPYLDEAGPAPAPEPEPVYAAIVELDGGLTIELGYRTTWDEEHTLGARLRDGQLVELNGSVLEP